MTRRAVECRKCQRHDANDDDAVDESGPTCEEWHGDRQEGNEEQWIEKIELFLHRQRPIVVYRGLWLRVEEVWLNRIEMNVAEKYSSPPGVAGQRGCEFSAGQEPCRDQGDHQNKKGGRNQTTSTPGVEAQDVDLFRGLELTKKEARYEETRNDEENVQSDHPAGNGISDVEKNDDDQGECSEAFQIGTIGAITRRRAGIIPGWRELLDGRNSLDAIGEFFHPSSLSVLGRCRCACLVYGNRRAATHICSRQSVSALTRKSRQSRSAAFEPDPSSLVTNCGGPSA